MAPRQAPRASVLVVDDDPRNLRLLDAVLRPLQVAIVMATSGEVALEHAATRDFAVILLDVQMPVMDGFETAARLKSAERSHSTPILFLTASLGDGVVVKAYAQGAVDYITKPFDAEILRSKVSVFVDLFLAKEEVRRQAAILSDRERSDLLAREQRARADADRQVERLRLLADAGAALTVSLDRDVILQALARSLVPRFCDFCTFDVTPVDAARQAPERGGEVPLRDAPEAAALPLLELVVVEHTDPAEAIRVRHLRQAHPLDPREPRGLLHTLTSGEAELYDTPSEPRVGEPLRTLFHELGMTSAVVVPMRAHGEVMGVMTAGVTAWSGRPAYTLDDLRLAQGIGVRAAVGLVNARLHGEARAAIRLRDDFLSVASHELRTPLTSLRLTIEGLRRGAGQSGDERVAAKLRAGERQIGRLADLIGQLLDVSRLVSGSLQLNLEDVDLSLVVNDVIAGSQDQIARSGSAIEVSLPEAGSAMGRWDALRVEQVVTNLLSNAIKYGEGKAIEVHATAGPASIRLVVRDHGIGIDPAHQARIFERFERAVSIRHYGGFGLGLWITRQIVEELGGGVRVESSPGAGSAFTVDLPRLVTPRSSVVPKA